MRGTNFTANDSVGGIQAVYGVMATDAVRNAAIVADVVAALDEGRVPLVLTERTEHLGVLAAALRDEADHIVVLKGGRSAAQRKESEQALAELVPHARRVLLATGRYIGEGFDHAPLDTLFLAMPVAWKGTPIQYVGRLHRQHPSKREVRIYDYVDRQVPMLARMFEKRRRGYRAMGYAENALF